MEDFRYQHIGGVRETQSVPKDMGDGDGNDEDGEIYCQFQITPDDNEEGVASEASKKSSDHNAKNRPSSLVIPCKVKSFIKSDGVLEERQAYSQAPKIRSSSNISAPNTPLFPAGPNFIVSGATDFSEVCASSWAGEDGSYLRGSIPSIDEAQEAGFLSPEDAISVSSVESAYGTKRRSSPKSKKSFSRLSLNLISKDERSQSPTSETGKSPSLLPKFLRNSIGKLIGRKGNSVSSSVSQPVSASVQRKDSPGSTRTDSPAQNSLSSQELKFHLPSSGTSPDEQISHSHKSNSSFTAIENNASNNNEYRKKEPEDKDKLSKDSNISSPEVSSVLQCSPDTLMWFEESKINGLPVIPFAFPTHVVAERLRQKSRQLARENSKHLSGDSNQGERSEPKPIVKRRLSVLDYNLGGEDQPKSLDNLVMIAESELANESLMSSSPEPGNRGLSGSATSFGSVNSSLGVSGKWPFDREIYYDDLNPSASVFDDFKCAKSRAPQGRSCLKRSCSDGEDDGYMEMIPKSGSTTPMVLKAPKSLPAVRAIIRPSLDDGSNKPGDQVHEYPEEEPHFMMDFSAPKD